MITFKLEGGKELAAALKNLPDAISLRVQREALRAGAEPMRAHAASLAPRGPDAPHIADNIVIGAASGKAAEEFIREDAAAIAVGPSKDFFYGFFWEYGTIKQPARPFMRPAFDTQAPRSLEIIGQRLGEAIIKAANRLSKAAGLRTTRGQSTGVGV